MRDACRQNADDRVQNKRERKIARVADDQAINKEEQAKRHLNIDQHWKKARCGMLRGAGLPRHRQPDCHNDNHQRQDHLAKNAVNGQDDAHPASPSSIAV